MRSNGDPQTPIKNLGDWKIGDGQYAKHDCRITYEYRNFTLCGSYYSVDGQLFYRNHTLCDKALRYKSS